MPADTTTQAGADSRQFSSQSHPKKIVVVLSGLTAGGSERVISLLVNHWAAQGRDITVVSFDKPEKPFFPIDSRVDVRQLGLATAKGFSPRAILQLWKRVQALRSILRDKSPDLVLSFLTKVNVTTLLASRGLPVPVIVSERNNPQRQGFGRIWSTLRDLLYPSATRLVAMTKRAIDALPPSSRRVASVIPNPVMLPATWQAHRGGRRVVAVGRLVEQKGFDILLDAFAAIAPEFPDWTLVIWGEGQLRAALEAQRDRLGLSGSVEMPGVTPRPASWVEDADIFVLSSRYEGWGIVLTEAMAAGLPVVSFDCPFGPAEMVTTEVDGILVAPEDANALAGALRRVIADPNLRGRLGDAALKSSQQFAPSAVMARWDDVVSETFRDYAARHPKRVTRA